MLLPVWLIPMALKAGAALVGTYGVVKGIEGASKMIDANDTMKEANRRHGENMETFEAENKTTTETMDKLGKFELEILESFKEFSDVFEKIKNKPKISEVRIDGVTLPQYDGEQLKEVYVGATALLGALGGAGLGAAGGFAAAGATTAAVMAFGTASTGTAISSLGGVALTNATLAALGGGSLAVGGGGMAAGAAALGAATLGVGLMVGGIVFSFAGQKLSDQADEAWAQMKKAEAQIDKICEYLTELRETADHYYWTLYVVNDTYRMHLDGLKAIVEVRGCTDWNNFTENEKLLTHNTVLLVGLLHNMCKVKLVLQTENENETNIVNSQGVQEQIDIADKVMADRFLKNEPNFILVDRKVAPHT